MGGEEYSPSQRRRHGRVKPVQRVREPKRRGHEHDEHGPQLPFIRRTAAVLGQDETNVFTPQVPKIKAHRTDGKCQIVGDAQQEKPPAPAHAANQRGRHNRCHPPSEKRGRREAIQRVKRHHDSAGDGPSFNPGEGERAVEHIGEDERAAVR